MPRQTFNDTPPKQPGVCLIINKADSLVEVCVVKSLRDKFYNLKRSHPDYEFHVMFTAVECTAQQLEDVKAKIEAKIKASDKYRLSHSKGWASEINRLDDIDAILNPTPASAPPEPTSPTEPERPLGKEEGVHGDWVPSTEPSPPGWQGWRGPGGRMYVKTVEEVAALPFDQIEPQIQMSGPDTPDDVAEALNARFQQGY